MTLWAVTALALGSTFLAAGIAGAPLEPVKLAMTFALSAIAISIVVRLRANSDITIGVVAILTGACALVQHDALPQLWRFLVVAPFCWIVRGDRSIRNCDAALAYGAVAGTLLVLFA